MNIPSAPSSSLPKIKSLLPTLANTVRALTVAGVLASPVLAQQPSSDKLARAEQLNSSLMDDLAAKNKILENIWLKLQNEPGIPTREESFDKWGHFTPQFLKWAESLPEVLQEKNNLIAQYESKKNTLASLPPESSAWKIHSLDLANLGLAILGIIGAYLLIKLHFSKKELEAIRAARETAEKELATTHAAKRAATSEIGRIIASVRDQKTEIAPIDAPIHSVEEGKIAPKDGTVASEGKTKIAPIKEFESPPLPPVEELAITRTNDDNPSTNAPASPMETSAIIPEPRDLEDAESPSIDAPLSPLESLRSQLDKIQTNSLCILVSRVNCDIYMYLTGRKDTDDGGVSWSVWIEKQEITMHLSPGKDIVMKYTTEEGTKRSYSTSFLEDVAKMEIINTAVQSIRRYPPQFFGQGVGESTIWYTVNSKASEHIQPGKRLMVTTQSGSVYILEVLPDNEGFKILPESPKSSYDADITIFHHIDDEEKLVGEQVKTSPILQIFPLDTVSSVTTDDLPAPEIKAIHDQGTPALQQETLPDLDRLSPQALEILLNKKTAAYFAAYAQEEVDQSLVGQIKADIETIKAHMATLPAFQDNPKK